MSFFKVSLFYHKGSSLVQHLVAVMLHLVDLKNRRRREPGSLLHSADDLCVHSISESKSVKSLYVSY